MNEAMKEYHLKQLLQDYGRLDELTNLLGRLFGTDYEALVLEMLWKVYDHYRDVVADAVGDEDGVIDKYVYNVTAGEEDDHPHGMGQEAVDHLLTLINAEDEDDRGS
jgi:hypothetical protein